MTVENQDNFRDALDIAANLRALGAHYYTVGSEVARARKDEDLRMKLRAAISGPRYEKIFDWSRSSTGSDASALLDNLTDEERALFQAGSDAHNAILDWKSRRATTRLGASDLFVAGGRGLG